MWKATVTNPNFKGAQVWDFRSLRFSLYYTRKPFWVRSWCVHSACAWVPYAHEYLTRMSTLRAWAPYAHEYLTRMLSARINSWRECLAWFEGLFQIWNFYAHAEQTRKELMRMLSVRISSWCVWSANTSVPDRKLRVRISLWWVCSAWFEGTALLKIRLSIHVRNFAAPKESLNIF